MLIFGIFAGISACFNQTDLDINTQHTESIMEEKEKRVTGIGGIFFKSADPAASREWYQKHLGFKTDEYGTSFEFRSTDNPEKKGFTLWSPFNKTTKYFGAEDQSFMINFRVQNLEKLLEDLKAEGVEIVDTIESFEYGKFAHIVDLEGNRIELWEPFDTEYEKMIGDAATH